MVHLQRILILVLASTFPSVKISVNGSENPCTTNNTVDLTGATPHSSGFVENEGKVYLPKSIWTVDGRRLGCPCGSGDEKCLRLCCPFDQVQIDGSCTRHNGTRPRIRVSIDNEEHEEIVSEMDFFLHNDDPCNFDWMTSVVSDNFSVLKNGSIYDSELGGKSLSNFKQYCLFREPRSGQYSAKVCRPWVRNFFWDVLCLTVAAFVMVVIFVVYSLVPELNNLHGMMFRSYLASYVLTYLSAVTVELTAQSEDNAEAFRLSLYFMEFWGVSCTFWLNAMSFDIWRAVRCLRSIDSHYQEDKKRKYIRYAIYAWITPAILISSYATAMHCVPRFQNVLIRQTFRKFCRIGVKSSIFICNTIFYVMTAIVINRHKKDLANLAAGVNKHHDADKQWINLHVKLYLIMGGHMVPWIIWDMWPNPATTSALVALEMLQSFFLFFVFLWKDNIKRSLLQRFGKNWYRREYASNASDCATGTTVF